MHIVVDGKIKSTSQLGSDMLPLVHGKPGEERWPRKNEMLKMVL